MGLWEERLSGQGCVSLAMGRMLCVSLEMGRMLRKCRMLDHLDCSSVGSTKQVLGLGCQAACWIPMIMEPLSWRGFWCTLQLWAFLQEG